MMAEVISSVEAKSLNIGNESSGPLAGSGERPEATLKAEHVSDLKKALAHKIKCRDRATKVSVEVHTKSAAPSPGAGRGGRARPQYKRDDGLKPSRSDRSACLAASEDSRVHGMAPRYPKRGKACADLPRARIKTSCNVRVSPHSFSVGKDRDADAHETEAEIC